MVPSGQQVKKQARLAGQHLPSMQTSPFAQQSEPHTRSGGHSHTLLGESKGTQRTWLPTSRGS